MPARLNDWLVLAAVSLFALIANSAAVGQQLSPADRQRLGEDLLRAAERRDWKQARKLLEAGADPNVTAFTPQKPIPKIDWRAWRALERPSALSQAAEQGNGEAVKLLLRFHAKLNLPKDRDGGPLLVAVQAGQTETARLLLDAGADWSKRRDDNHNALDLARFSGKRDMIRLLEDTAQVPLPERTIPQIPFGPGAQTARPEIVPGTLGAFPLRHLLWVSPHELIMVHENPRRFGLLDLKAKAESKLPELSRRWVAEKHFDPNMLALSPDGAWLVGFGGTDDKPMWVATEVRGDGRQEWPRDIASAKSRTVVEKNPLIAWIDNARWVELNHTGTGFVARVRTHSVDTTTELPLDVPKYLPDFPAVLFKFPRPDEGQLGGQVGVTAPARSEDGQFKTSLTRVMPGSDRWRLEQREVVWPRATHPGFFYRSVLSPDGQHLAWNCYFSETEARDFIISDAEGSSARIVYEHLYPMGDSKKRRAESPWTGVLEWTPQGDALVFWRGEHGENGLCLLPLSHE